MKNSKRYIPLFFLLLLIGACAAGKGGKEAVPTVALDEAIGVAVSDSVQFRDGDSRFWVRVNNIQDNRCPQNVNCITGGKAVVSVAVGDSGEVANICTGADCVGGSGNSFLFRSNNTSYNIVLEEVLPYPAAGQELEQKQAILKIKRATS